MSNDREVTHGELMVLWVDTELRGHDHGLSMDKLRVDRVENLRREDDLVRFEIERHGETVRGSSRGQVHHWVIDTRRRERWIEMKTVRQVSERAKPVVIDQYVKPILDGIESADPRVVSSRANGSVRINIEALIPNVGYRQTVQGRRRRLRMRLNEELTHRSLVIDSRWFLRAK